VAHLTTKKLEAGYNGILKLLKITYGSYFCIIGFDKFFALFTESQNRVSALTLQLIPLSMPQLLGVVGILELFIGLLIFSKFMRLGIYLGIGLLILIVVNLIAMSDHFDIAIHGLAIALGMVAFAQLIALKKLINMSRTS
jgi:hypothetical protein